MILVTKWTIFSYLQNVSLSFAVEICSKKGKTHCRLLSRTTPLSLHLASNGLGVKLVVMVETVSDKVDIGVEDGGFDDVISSVDITVVVIL